MAEIGLRIVNNPGQGFFLFNTTVTPATEEQFFEGADGIRLLQLAFNQGEQMVLEVLSKGIVLEDVDDAEAALYVWNQMKGAQTLIFDGFPPDTPPIINELPSVLEGCLEDAAKFIEDALAFLGLHHTNLRKRIKSDPFLQDLWRGGKQARLKRNPNLREADFTIEVDNNVINSDSNFTITAWAVEDEWLETIVTTPPPCPVAFVKESAYKLVWDVDSFLGITGSASGLIMIQTPVNYIGVYLFFGGSPPFNPHWMIYNSPDAPPADALTFPTNFNWWQTVVDNPATQYNFPKDIGYTAEIIPSIGGGVKLELHFSDLV